MSFRFGDFSATLRMREYSIYEYMLYGFDVRIYIHVYVYIYIYVDIFIIHVPPTLKRSMYDYKLYVSLLIFVHSLMDSDERASLQKKMVKPNTTNEITNNAFIYIS